MSAFLAAVLRRPRFVEGRLSTDFIAEQFGERFEGAPLDERDGLDLAAAAVAHAARRGARARLRSPAGWPTARIPCDWVVRLDEREVGLHAEQDGDAVVVSAGGRTASRAARLAPRPAARPASSSTTARSRCRSIAAPRAIGSALGGSEVQALVRTRKAAEFAARIPRQAAAGHLASSCSRRCRA